MLMRTMRATSLALKCMISKEEDVEEVEFRIAKTMLAGGKRKHGESRRSNCQEVDTETRMDTNMSTYTRNKQYDEDWLLWTLAIKVLEGEKLTSAQLGFLQEACVR